MKKLITLLALGAVTLYAHKNYGLSRETKIVAITILAEARGEGEAGMYAVGACIAQRAFERKKTPQEICLQKFQFSCWNGKKLSDLEHLLKTKEGKNGGRPEWPPKVVPPELFFVFCTFPYSMRLKYPGGLWTGGYPTWGCSPLL